MASLSTSIDPAHTVGQLVVENPARSRVFENYGIDYCCGGKKPLTEACERKEVDVERVVSDLLQADKARAQSEGPDVSSMSLCDLVDHIVSTHHAYLRVELPRLEAMALRVRSVHGANHSWLAPLHETVVELVSELTSHMMKEEHILFPNICQMEKGQQGGAEGIAGPISVMEQEHDAAGSGLERLRELSSDFTPPDGACNTFRAMLDGLAELERDLHSHIHKENNILFPRALEMAAQG